MPTPQQLDEVTTVYMKLMNFLSWATIAKTVIVMLIAAAFYVTFENRQLVYKGIVANNASVRTMIQSPISEDTKVAVNVLLSKPSNIVGIQLVSVDFRTNTRKSEYFRSLQPRMEEIVTRYLRNKLTDTPFFSADIANNERNTALMNGEFICSPIKGMSVFAKFPEVNEFADTVCSVSIPPYPGYFSGYVTMYIKGAPSVNEIQDLRIAARKLALTSYDLEITR